MARVTNGLVVHAFNAFAVGFRQGTYAAGCIECFVAGTVNFNFLAALEWHELDMFAVEYGRAGIQVLVYQSVGRPVQRIFQRVVGMLWKCTHPQAYLANLIEMGNQFVGSNTDKPGSQTALGNKCRTRAVRTLLDLASYLYIFRQIEIVNSSAPGHLSNQCITEIR